MGRLFSAARLRAYPLEAIRRGTNDPSEAAERQTTPADNSIGAIRSHDSVATTRWHGSTPDHCEGAVGTGTDPQNSGLRGAVHVLYRYTWIRCSSGATEPHV